MHKRNLLSCLVLIVLTGQVLGMEIERPVRHWEFLDAVSSRAAVLGRETGVFEAWVYPVKLLREFQLGFKLNGRIIPPESVVRSVVYRAGSTTLTYSGDYYAEHFLVRQTFLAPPDEPGILIRLEIESSADLELEASFVRDFTLMWPAGLGGTFGTWDEGLNAFVMGEDLGRFFAAVGSPEAALLERDYGTNYSASQRSAMSLGQIRGRAERTIALAASFESRQDLEAVYRRLLDDPAELQRGTEAHYQAYLNGLPELRLPDPDFEQAFRWSMLSMAKGLVRNPFLEGRGLVAGFGLSKGEPRPGFAWFFGRDSFWTTLALTVGGDPSSAREAIRFIAQFQRDDGKIPHEISQGAPFIPWFERYPYSYASADATSLYVIAVHDYLLASGDVDFVRESWPRLTRALDFLAGVEDEAGFAANQGVGHGWVEGGPLLPVRTEFYQAGLYVEALRAMARLADLLGEAQAAAGFEEQFQAKQASLERTYWMEESGRYAFAIDREGRRVDEPGVLATVPMWFGLLEQQPAQRMIRVLSGEDHISDWGSRIISSKSPLYGPAGYHFGSVWPLFSGWASVGEYRYHAAHPAYANLAANVGLALDGSGGHTTEVVSGAVYSPLSTSSSHQIWSAAMVVSPLLRGLLGLQIDVPARRVDLIPHLPAHWDGFELKGLEVGPSRLDLSMTRTAGDLRLQIQNRGGQRLRLTFAPALSPAADLEQARFNGQPVGAERLDGGLDWHPVLDLDLPAGESVVELSFQRDFGVTAPAPLPAFGRPSSNLKVLAEDWSTERRRVELLVSGRPGRSYRLQVRGGEGIAEVVGGQLDGPAHLRLSIPGPEAPGYREHRVTIRLR